MTTLLAVDIGNTNVSLGVFEGERLRATWRLSTDAGRTEDEHALILDGFLRGKGIDAESVDAVSMCSVVPPLTDVIRRALVGLFGDDVLEIGRGARTGVKVSYDRPQDVGTDRIVDAAAAYATYGGPTIVVDIGTATVFDAISEDGEYLGGAIAPGIALSAETLFRETSQLRRVALEAPGTAIGRNTVAAVQSGLLFGYVSLVEGMVSRFKAELAQRGGDDAHVVATGGYAPVIARETDVFTAVDEDLTLVGLRLLYEMNR